MRTISRAVTGAAAAPISPLDALSRIHMSQHERRQAEQDMRMAEQLVDWMFDLYSGSRATIRRVFARAH